VEKQQNIWANTFSRGEKYHVTYGPMLMLGVVWYAISGFSKHYQKHESNLS